MSSTAIFANDIVGEKETLKNDNEAGACWTATLTYNGELV